MARLVIHGMDLFRKAVKSKVNVNFDQKKGNLFEYIEAAKFNKNAAKTYMTDLLSGFEDKIVTENQCDTALLTMVDFANRTGIALQHTNMADFSEAMVSDHPFKLG